MPKRFWNQIWRLLALLVGIWLLFDLASHLIAEVLWFQKLGYLTAFLLRLSTQLGLWAIVFFTSAGFLLGNLFLAARLQYPQNQAGKPVKLTWDYNSGEESSTAYPDIPKFGLRWLLLLVTILNLLASAILLYYGQQTFRIWQTKISQIGMTLPQLPPQFGIEQVQQLLPLQMLLRQPWQLVFLVAVSIALALAPRFWLSAIAVGLSLLFSFIVSEQWGKVLLYFHPTSFNLTEPLFERDVSFYVFSLPIWELLKLWLFGLVLYSVVAVGLIYLRSGNSLSQGRFLGFSQPQRCHLNGLGITLMLAIAYYYWLRRYELLYSTRGVNYGASYTAVNVQLPISTGLSLLAVAIAIYLLWRVFVLSRSTRAQFKTVPYPPQLVYVLVLYSLVAALASSLLPSVVQRLVVQPNELARERPYIERTIALTRQAFDLDDIETRTFAPQGQLTLADLQQNDLTIRNIRLWDTRPILQTNRQLQQIRLYYRFPDADIDRYTILSREPEAAAPAEKQQVILTARELDYSAVPPQAQTWVNQHLIYTHGYGFTMSPVNTADPSGLPEYYVKNIGIGVATGGRALEVASDRIRASIPIGAPRIYYGELTDNYVMTATRVNEFDYPSGDENVYNTYDGRGGIPIGSWWARLLFAEYLKDWQMLFTRNFTPQTKLLFRRNIKERVQAVAPFLRYDRDPYLVVADANSAGTAGTPTAAPNYLYWILDAYTTSDRYPYSDPGEREFNYIRNAVKVVIDAYNGSVVFYVADPDDPIINAWGRIFPNMFRPLSDMPVTLRSHIRYPVDFYGVQSERLLTYHMTDPQVFYNREDQWQIPTEIYGNKPQKVEPYYLIMRLPTANSEEFILLLPFTPTQRNNLIGWLAGRSDAENYGKLFLYEFPKQELVYGPEQIEARINQDPVISQQISLWNRQGSRAIQGNLLVIPIERSLLYVEPLYLEAEQNSLPILARVIVAYENRIVMAETLQQALQVIFTQADTEAPAIIRQVEEPAVPSP